MDKITDAEQTTSTVATQTDSDVTELPCDFDKYESHSKKQKFVKCALNEDDMKRLAVEHGKEVIALLPTCSGCAHQQWLMEHGDGSQVAYHSCAEEGITEVYFYAVGKFSPIKVLMKCIREATNIIHCIRMMDKLFDDEGWHGEVYSASCGAADTVEIDFL